ncbi:DUF6262 family protein [Nonomuraea recticatena]|uniref:TetR family transcriptional regulator n=1 Tax=Nonomuraea recticatena TaxID=46178 RepID=A0ABP6E421_9ACTN
MTSNRAATPPVDDHAATTSPLVQARRRDTLVRTQRVHDALSSLQAAGADITISAVARAARVHRSFLHRHPDLHAAVLTAATQPQPPLASGVQVSTASLRADLLNAQQRNTRLHRHVLMLEARLSEALGQAAVHAAGLQVAGDSVALRQRITELEQLHLDLRRQLEERTDELLAARAANRELMAALNRPSLP